MRLNGKPFNLSIIQVYAPTTAYDDNEIESFYESVQQIKNQDITIIMGDFNAKIGEGSEPNGYGWTTRPWNKKRKG